MVEVPPPRVISNHLPELREFFLALFELRVPRSTLVTSWYRDPEKNAAVGGHPRSLHLSGLALDLVLPTRDVAGFVAMARAAGLIAVAEPDHVHVQALSARQLDERLVLRA
ncbi:MAG: D-Ala-D-Ala carboxypeptidase family metallohydrolase [Planctomycetota bacterium]|jgi:uncharacterized protein YcbK (DUF882 family)